MLKSAQEFKKGDILLMSQERVEDLPKWKQPFAKAFGAANRAIQGSYTHAGIYVGDGQVVEAMHDGVQKRTLRKSLGGYKGVVVARRSDLTDAQRDMVARHARKYLGEPYSLAQAAGAGLNAITGAEVLGKAVDKARPRGFQCGGLVACAFEDAGVPLTRRGRKIPVRGALPTGLLASDAVEIVAHRSKGLALKAGVSEASQDALSKFVKSQKGGRKMWSRAMTALVKKASYDDELLKIAKAKKQKDPRFEKGDILLFTLDKYEDMPAFKRTFARVFGKANSALQGLYTHAGMYSGDGKLIEGTHKGMVERPISESIKYKGLVVARVKGLSKKQKNKVVDEARKYLGEPYSALQAVATGSNLKFKERITGKLLDKIQPRGFQCGGIVAQAYNDAGVPFKEKGNKVEVRTLAPIRLLNQDNVHIVAKRQDFVVERPKGKSIAHKMGRRAINAPRRWSKSMEEKVKKAYSEVGYRRGPSRVAALAKLAAYIGDPE